jgi:hypothetical protein
MKLYSTSHFAHLFPVALGTSTRTIRPSFILSCFSHVAIVVSLTRRPPFIPQEDSWYSFLLEAESTSGP